jgi:hypothetical protein
MPKLKFLDAKRVDKSELLSALQLQTTFSHNEQAPLQSANESRRTRMESFDKIKRFFGLSPKEVEAVGGKEVSQRDAYTPLPADDEGGGSTSSHKTLLGKVKMHYEGSQSQGNRFIMNQDL